MKNPKGLGRHRSSVLYVAALALAFSTYIEKAISLPSGENSNQWPTFSRRNIAALAREGLLKSTSAGYKRSISTLAKNGQLPTFRSPYNENDKQEQDEEETHDKRNIASIARLRSYAAAKRNIQALARDGYLGGRGQYNPQNDKRNIASLARQGMIHKKDDSSEDEYYYPFYQNPIPPISEIDGPYDYNQLYDLQQSITPDMFPPLSQAYKRDAAGTLPLGGYHENQFDIDDNWYLKRGAVGMPVHGLYRPIYMDPNGRTKRYILSLPDFIDRNDIQPPEEDINENEDKRSVDEESDVRESFEKRHIGSLARLGLLPSFRFTGGRYSRSGRARLLLPSQELYRKYTPDENFGIRQYLSTSEAESAINSDDTELPSAPVSSHSHPTGRIRNKPLKNDFPISKSRPFSSPPLSAPNYIDAVSKNEWKTINKEIPKFYYFRSLKVPYHTSGKRYLLLPAVDNILLRKNYPNSSLPGRRKNQ